MDFDKKILDELLEALSTSDGGVVLESDGQPAAVVLSASKYSELNAASAVPSSPMPAVLVVGGAGYIGAHVTRLLLEEGLLPVVLDNLSSGRREHIIPPAVFVQGDVHNMDLLRQLCRQYKFLAVIHLAGSLEVGESVERPVQYLDNNMIGLWNLLSVLDEYSVQRVIFSSTAAVYGEPEVMPITEDIAPHPLSPYGASNFISEQVLEYFARYRNFRVSVMRYFNVAGQVPEWEIGDTHPHSHLFPTLLTASLSGDRFILYGGDWPTRDGSCLRDYIHVLDVARAHVALLRAENLTPYQVYNLGTGHGTTVKEVVTAVAEVAGKIIPLEIGERRTGDVASLVSDGSKISRELGFNLKFSSLKDIILSLWKPSQFNRS